jgi:hypothetical protein
MLKIFRGNLVSGKLRPAEQSPRRIVPDHIPRPDYSDNPEGHPTSELRMKGNSYVRQLDAEEIEGLGERHLPSTIFLQKVVLI